MCLKLYIADTGVLREERLFNQYYGTLSEYRRQKVDQMRHPADKCLSLGAGLLLKRALSDSGRAPEELQVLFNPYGKPYFRGLPDFHFNLSHSENRVFCVVSPVPVGCDVEKIGVSRTQLAEAFFAPEEYRRLVSLPAAQQPDFFYRLWVLKESYMKATGLGFSLPLRDFVIQFEEGGLSVRHNAAPAVINFFEPVLNDGYRYACCVLGEAKPEPLEIIDFASPFLSF